MSKKGAVSKVGSVEESKSSGEELPFEGIIGKLEKTVEKLEQGELSLEESISAFEEGIRLSRMGSKRLNEAEHRVEMLLGSQESSGDQQPPDDKNP